MSMTVLPPIPSGGGFLTQKVLESIPWDKAHDPCYKPIRKHPGRQFSVPGFVPVQSNEIKDTAKYRNSFLHNLCVEMLKAGFHLAFRDLFSLINSEINSEADKFDHADIHIEDCPDKLTYIKDQLITAELAQRQGHSDKIYDAQFSLSKFFEQLGNFRLAHHFYTASYNTSKQIRGDGRRKEAEANYYLGTAAEREKDYSLAQKLYEEYYALTTNKEWKLEGGETLHKHARDCLTSVLITLSEELTPDDESNVLEYLHKAYDLVKGCNDINGTNYVGYLLGSKYDSYGHHEKAVQYLTEYLDLCKSNQDDLGTGKAFQALAYAHQRQGNMEEAAENLKMFLYVMEKGGDADTLREACSDLGALHNYIGQYDQSSNYYKRAYQMAHNKNDIESSRCEYGMSLAHGLLKGEVETITHLNKSNIESLLYWKSERVQGFTTDDQTYSMYLPLNSNVQQNKVVKDEGKVDSLETMAKETPCSTD